MDCADFYLDDLHAYQRAIDLLKYAISLDPDCFICICAAFEQMDDANAASIRFSDIYSSFIHQKGSKKHK